MALVTSVMNGCNLCNKVSCECPPKNKGATVSAIYFIRRVIKSQKIAGKMEQFSCKD